MDAITLLESKDCSLFIFSTDVVSACVVDDKWEGR
jgi:hypothetical protein